MQETRWEKTPNEELPFDFDFAPLTNGVFGAKSDFLESDERIDSATVTAETGMAAEAVSIVKNSTAVRFTARGGTAKSGTGRPYLVTCLITTTNAVVAEWSRYVYVVASKRANE